MKMCLRGHREEGLVVAFTRDGDRLISRSLDGDVRVWHATTGMPLPGDAEARTLTGGTPSSDGRWLATGRDNGTVSLQDLEREATPRVLVGHRNKVTSVAFSEDGSRLVSGSADRTVRLWETASGTQLRSWDVGAWVTCVAMTPDGRTIATGADDGYVRLWDVATGTHPDVFTSRSYTLAVAFSPDGRRLATGGYDCIVRVWDVERGELQSSWRGHTERVTSLACSPDGLRVASGSDDMTVRLWQLSGGPEPPLVIGHSGFIHDVRFTPDGGRVITKDLDDTTLVWDAQTGQCVEAAEGHASGGGLTLIDVDARLGRLLAAPLRRAPAQPLGSAAPDSAPFRALAEGLELVFTSARTGEAVAWFPARLGLGVSYQPALQAHPGGRRWAPAVDTHLYLLVLEDADDAQITEQRHEGARQGC